jgi:hypothetical protein
MNPDCEDLVGFTSHLNRIYVNVPSYAFLWQTVVAGGLPAERVGSRWRLPSEAEAVAVKRFGLRRRHAAVRTGRTLASGPEAV